MFCPTSTCPVMMAEDWFYVQGQQHHDEGVTLSLMGQISRLWSYLGLKWLSSYFPMQNLLHLMSPQFFLTPAQKSSFKDVHQCEIQQQCWLDEQCQLLCSYLQASCWALNELHKMFLMNTTLLLQLLWKSVKKLLNMPSIPTPLFFLYLKQSFLCSPSSRLA